MNLLKPSIEYAEILNFDDVIDIKVVHVLYTEFSIVPSPLLPY